MIIAAIPDHNQETVFPVGAAGLEVYVLVQGKVSLSCLHELHAIKLFVQLCFDYRQQVLGGELKRPQLFGLGIVARRTCSALVAVGVKAVRNGVVEA